MSLRKTERGQCFGHSTVQQSIVKWFFVLLLVMVAFSLHPYRVRFSVTAKSKRKNICAVGVDDESLSLLDMSCTQLKPYYRGILRIFLLQTIHIYVENIWAKFETISSMIRHTSKAKEKSRYVQEKQWILS